MDPNVVATLPPGGPPKASFLGLPPELRDLIYFFAYDRSATWSRRQTNAQRVANQKQMKERRAQVHRVSHQL